MDVGTLGVSSCISLWLVQLELYCSCSISWPLVLAPRRQKMPSLTVHTLAAAFGPICGPSGLGFPPSLWSRLAGAAYLAYLGLRMLLCTGELPPVLAAWGRSQGLGVVYVQAVLTNVLNQLNTAFSYQCAVR